MSNISSSLLKKFVDVTSEEEARTGYYSYGTAIVDGENKYVQLDGSDALTSVSIATDLASGDRVLIYVENHTASVIGNITCPASGRTAIEVDERLLDAETWIVGELQAISAEFEEVYANYASIEYLNTYFVSTEYLLSNYIMADIIESTYATIDDLTVTNARINKIESTEITAEYLETNYANITDLNVLKEQVQNLDAKYATIEWVEATYATIENLDAVAAYIYELNADFANIKNLLAGVAGVGELDAIHLTSDNVVIQDALITNAMIDSITADKITAGTIYTSKVRIQTAEEDESLYMDNSLIQMSDDDQIRMQMGKDATGEYNLYIWNAEGAMMFDATGATADGIGKEVIVNTHVADDANIAGYKLDIASVASELNADGSITVDAARVYIDGNTLDYALSEITDLIYGISMNGLKNFTVYFCLYDSDTEWPPLPDEIVPALTDEAETDYSFTDVYDQNDFWTEDQPQAEDGQYVWFIYWLEYEDGTTMWSNPICLTDGFIRRQTNYIFTELEVIQGEISAKVWMTDIEESLNTEISELWAQLDITIGDVLIEVGDLIYDSVGTLTEQVAAIEVEYNNISMTVESIQDNYVTKGSLVLTLDEETGVATLTAEANAIEFYTDQISIDSEYFKLYKNGYIESTSGLIGGWYIGTQSIFYGPESLDDHTYGTYIGVDGILQRSNDSNGRYTENYVRISNGVFRSNIIYLYKYPDSTYSDDYGDRHTEITYHGYSFYYDESYDDDFKYNTKGLINILDGLYREYDLFIYDKYVDSGEMYEGFWSINIDNSGVDLARESWVYPTDYDFDRIMHFCSSSAIVFNISECSADRPNASILFQNRNPILELSNHGDYSKDTYFRVTSWSGSYISFGVGSGGSNRGIYDHAAGGWLVYVDSSNKFHLGGSTIGGAQTPIYLNSGVPTACSVSTSNTWYKMCGIACCFLNGTTPVNFDGPTSGYLPKARCYVPVLAYNGSKWYLACVRIDTGGTYYFYVYTSYASGSTDITTSSSYQIYGTITYVTA